MITSPRQVGGVDAGKLAAVCNLLLNLSGWLLPLMSVRGK